MNVEEFLNKAAEDTATEETKITSEENVKEVTAADVELDVQKAVVESLAAEKAEQDEHLESLKREVNALKSQIANLTDIINQQKVALEKVGDVLSANQEAPLSNQIALLDRNSELDDRFAGETRDHVIEALQEARNRAEEEGRLRHGQILESVLVANSSSGNLARKRKELEKIFADNQNILNGTVINELDKLGITYKVGENYLLATEIVKRSY